MAVRAVKDKLKTSKSLPQVLSSCTLCNLVLGTEIGTRYRYIDDTPLVPMTEAGKANSTNAASSASGTKTRSRPNSEYVLYSYGEPVAMTNDSGTSYFGTDILGSVKTVTDKYGTVQADYSYDAFGSPYLGNLENDIGFGYCGKVYDVGTGLYDYGFRDYSPVSARFTTVDPIRDGANWFSYVVNDPVNYVDLLGLELTFIEQIENYLKQFSGEITNKTGYTLFHRVEDNDNGNKILTANDFELHFGIAGYSTLTDALSEYGLSKDFAYLDGLVLPDKSVYKGWTGSKITVVQKKDGSFKVQQSFGTFIVNSICNIGIALSNAKVEITGKGYKKEYYRFYNVDQVNEMEKNQMDVEGKLDDKSITVWRIEGQNVPNGYYNQKITGINNTFSYQGGIYGDISVHPSTNISNETVLANFANYARNNLTTGIFGFETKGCTK